MYLYSSKQESSKTLKSIPKSIRNGLYNIENLERNHLEMINVLSKWKDSSGFKTAVKLPYIYPSPFIKINKIKSFGEKSFKDNDPHNLNEQKISDHEFQPLQTKIPKLRQIDDSSHSQYINYVTPRKELYDVNEPLLFTTQNKKIYSSPRVNFKSTTKYRPLGVFNANVKRYKNNRNYEFSDENEESEMLSKVFKQTSIKYNTEISIIKHKMKMNHLDKNSLDEMTVKIQKLERHELEENSRRVKNHKDYPDLTESSYDNLDEMSEDEDSKAEPSSYLNIINSCQDHRRGKKTYNSVLGIVSVPSTPVNLFYNKYVDNDSLLSLHKSFIKFSSSIDLKTVSLSKRQLKKKNINLVDERVLDNYYELIRERELMLIDEMNLKYSNIKLEI